MNKLEITIGQLEAQLYCMKIGKKNKYIESMKIRLARDEKKYYIEDEIIKAVKE